MVDPVWAGVVGAIGGAGVGALTSLAAPLINWRVERKRTHIEWQRATIREWREGLATATEAYEEWQRKSRNAAASHLDTPKLQGQLWYESLRPHLSSYAEPSVSESAEYGTVRVLADEIARIERDWDLSPSPGRRAGASRLTSITTVRNRFR